MNESQWRSTAILLILLLVLPMRFVWESYPVLWACLLFWGPVSVLHVANICGNPRYRVGFTLMAVGALCNAVVTIANGGTMPVPGPPMRGVGSIWVEMGDESRLIWLADFLPGRMSIGDWILTAGIIAILVTALLRVFLDRPKAERAFATAA